MVWAPLRFSRSRALADEGREKGQYQTLTTAARESKYEALLRLVLSAGTPSGAQAGCRERGIFFLRTPFGDVIVVAHAIRPPGVPCIGARVGVLCLEDETLSVRGLPEA